MDENDLDAFFNATGADSGMDVNKAIANLLAGSESGEASPSPSSAERSGRVPPPSSRRMRPASPLPSGSPADGADDGGAEGRFVAFDPASFEDAARDAPFVLIPAHIHAYVPRWGWVAIGLFLVLLVAGVVLMPEWSLHRLASRLSGENEAEVQYAMRSLIQNGDERTVRTLFDLAASEEASVRTRLRAVDTMSLITGVPEVDHSLLRLELSGSTDERVRAAAIAARRQREASSSTRSGP